MGPLRRRGQGRGRTHTAAPPGWPARRRACPPGPAEGRSGRGRGEEYSSPNAVGVLWWFGRMPSPGSPVDSAPSRSAGIRSCVWPKRGPGSELQRFPSVDSCHLVPKRIGKFNHRAAYSTSAPPPRARVGHPRRPSPSPSHASSSPTSGSSSLDEPRSSSASSPNRHHRPGRAPPQGHPPLTQLGEHVRLFPFLFKPFNFFVHPTARLSGSCEAARPGTSHRGGPVGFPLRRGLP